MNVLKQVEVEVLASRLARRIDSHFTVSTGVGTIRVYGIPRGGVPVAYLAARYNIRIQVTDSPEDADVFVDDLIDSGATMRDWCDRFPGKPFFALLDKTDTDDAKAFPGWIVFPWENKAGEPESIEDNIRRIIQYVGDNPDRPGMLETPARIAKAYREWFNGYGMKEEDIFKVFEDGAENCDEFVIVRDIPFTSWCEHHGAMFKGLAQVGYIPSGKIVGLSKVVRLTRMYAHRFQVQERLTNQIADAMQRNLNPKAVAVVITAEHTCMSTRGCKAHGTDTVTSALRGAVKDDPMARSEFFSLLGLRGK